MAPDQAVEEARKIVGAHRSEPLGLCDLDHGWGYAALRLLDQSTDVPAAAQAANRDPQLGALTRTDLFQRWFESRTGRPDGEEVLKDFVRRHPGWYDASPGTTRRLTFWGNGTYDVRKIGALGEPESNGNWGFEAGKMWIELESGRREVTIEVGPWSYEMNVGTLGVFLPEPMTDGC
jgi:hypothetical protein